MPATDYTPPLPTSAELLRYIARHLGTKTKAFDEYVRKGYHDESLHRSLSRNAIIDPIALCAGTKAGVLVETILDNVFRQYHGFAARNWVGGLDKKALNGAITRLFADLGIAAIRFATREMRRPLLKLWLAEPRLLPFTLRWLADNNADFRDASARLQNPPTGRTVLKFDTIAKLAAEIRRKGTGADAASTAIPLIVARMVDSMAQAADAEGVLSALHRAEASQPREVDPWENQPFGQEAAMRANEAPRLALRRMIEGTDPLEDGAKEAIRAHIVQGWEAHRKTGSPATLEYILHHAEARFAAMTGDTKSALAGYKRAFGMSLYTAGEEQRDIIREALAVAAVEGDRVFLKKLKNQGAAFGLFAMIETDPSAPSTATRRSRSSDSAVEDWEILEWKASFPRLFRCDADEEIPPIILTDPNDLELDLRHPDRMVLVNFGSPKRIPQLVLRAQMNDQRAVAALLDAGADAALLSDAGESALLMALQWATPSAPPSERNETLFHLIHPRARAARRLGDPDCTVRRMANTATARKKLTLLGRAVETGNPDLVRLTLELGAAPDQRFGLEPETALYHCLGCLKLAADAKRARERMAECQSGASRELLRETKRRYGGEASADMEMTDLHHFLFDLSAEQMCKQVTAGSKDGLRAIARLLLESGASPNARHAIGQLTEYTPLMLAVENDEAELFELMLAHGGDPGLTCYSRNANRHFTCTDIARRWESHRVLHLLKTH